jgi:hypothetical protein
MKKIKMTSVIALFISTIGAGFNAYAQDQVTLNNNSGNEIGLLVDGVLNGSFVNDKTFLSATSPISLGSFIKAKGNKTNEVMAFTKDRPMEIYTSVPWTSGNDNITVPFANKILIPITIWIIYGDFEAVRTKVLNDLLTTSSVFNNERVGVDFSTITFMDATANPLASNYYNFNTNWDGLKSDIGFVNGQLNVYYTYASYIDGAYWTNAGRYATNGISGLGMIAMGSTTKQTVLVHEIGHGFGMAHITGLTGFDSTNVMTQQNRLSSLFFTEGQILRMHLSEYSVINWLYNARPGKLIRNCGSTATTATNTCPELQKRIWADGTAPPNVTENQIQNRNTNVKGLATNWLHLNCFDDEEGQNERNIILKHTELVPIFISVIQNGLDPEVLQEEKIMAGELYDRNIKMLIENKPEWITKELENKIRSVSREQFIANEIETATSNSISQAIKGLAILNQSAQSNEFFNGMKLTAYPNPAVNEKITIEYTLEKNSNNVCIFIFDQTGRRLVDKQYNDQYEGTYKVDIETNQLVPGTYFYQLNRNGHSFTKKFVISK